MPAYNKSPFAATPKVLVPSHPEYVWGSWSSLKSPTMGSVTNVAITSNVATVTVTINAGNIPVVGALITIQGTATSSGLFNVTNVALASVTITASTGQGTLTFPLTNANVSSTADGGTFLIPQPEVSEALANGASLPVAMPYATPFSDNNVAQTVSAVVSFPSLPTTATISLQGADFNQDSEFVTLATVGTVAGGAATATSATYTGKYAFYRLLNASVAGGTSPTIIGKIYI